ncbi:hypothetical protein GOBAR_AA01929 [Gossypium barbadense]|uniref:Nodulin-like domain-containing protein n=1 Tax=Gossypium barbadense TaxID=3634 RepID=A0A2P5YSN7_GOSBA|nr:hypothetical protein GOBAR_AA01929 [Gossypium barbadense]
MGNFGFLLLSSSAANYLPMWLVLILGSSLGLIGYRVKCLFFICRVSNLSYGAIFFPAMLTGNSICWINTVCYLVIIRNFPLAIGLTVAPVVRVIDAVKTKKAKVAFILIIIITTVTDAFTIMSSMGLASSLLSPFTGAVGMGSMADYGVICGTIWHQVIEYNISSSYGAY